MNKLEKLRLVRKAEVLRITGLSYSTITRRIAVDQFPKPIATGWDKNGDPTGYAWRESDIIKWLDEQQEVDVKAV